MDEERAGDAVHVGPRGLICVAFIPPDGRGRRAERCSYSVGVPQLDAEEALAFRFLRVVLRRSATEATRRGAMAASTALCDDWWSKGSTAAEAHEE